MDGDWEEVKKPIKKARPQQEAAQGQPASYGGKKGKNMLVAGAVRPQGRYGGPGAYSGGGGGGAAAAQQQPDVQNHASAVADYDFGVDEDEEIKYETVSHTCAQAVKAARMAAEMTQTALAKKVNEKTSTVVEVENGTARYNADLINRIERALNTRIDRGRKKPAKKNNRR